MVNVAFVGVGAIARRHLRNLKTIQDARVAAVCDPDPGALSKAVRSTGAAGYPTLEEMLGQEKDIDAAYVCIPINAHGKPEELLTDRGIHLFIEKPLPPDSTSLKRMDRAIGKSGGISSVGYHWRYSQATDRAMESIGDRTVGMVLGTWMTGLPQQKWWSERDKNPAQIFEQTTHLFDLSRYLVGEIDEVSSLFALRSMADVSELDDVSIVSLCFANGAIGAMCSTYMVSYKHPGRGIDRWRRSENPLLSKFAWATCNAGLWHPGYDTNSFRIELMVILRDLVLQVRQGSLITTESKRQRTFRCSVDPYLVESKTFIEAVAKGDDAGIRSNYQDARRTHEVIMSAIESASLCAPVRLEDRKSGDL